MAQELIRDGKLQRQATAEALQHFLESVVRAARLELKVSVRAVAPGGTGAEGDAEVLADLDGRDKEILLERGAELLKAFEHLAFRALRLEPSFHEKIHIDSGGSCANFPPAISAKPHVFARAAHRAFGVEGYERGAHGKYRHGGRATGGYPSRGQQACTIIKNCNETRTGRNACPTSRPSLLTEHLRRD